jgi:sugar O-acyltransferase (sialic acid O-acetyltransferase NeuD family)
MNIIIPKVGNSDSEVTISEIFVSNNERIQNGELIFTYETSKASFDFFAEIDGFINLYFQIGDIIQIGNICGEISGTPSSKETNKLSKIINDDESLLISNKAKSIISQENIDIKNFNNKLIRSKELIFYNEITKRKFKENDIVIYGSGGGGVMVEEILKDSTFFNLVGYIDDSKVLNTSVYDNFKVIGNKNLLQTFFDNGLTNIVIAFGFVDNLKVRYKIYNKLKKIGFNFPNIYHPKAIVEKSAKIGDGNIFLAGSYIGNHVSIGELNVFNTFSLVSHESSIGNNNHFAPNATIAGLVSINSHSLFGMNCNVFMKINIGSYCQINNGSCVNKDIPEKSII